MELTTAGQSLKDEWLSFHRQHPRIRIRDAARQMGTTEAEIIASFTGSGVVRLKDDFTGLWKRMPELGYIIALTRNEHCVHERKGTFENVQIGHKHMGFVAGPDIDLRMFFAHWAFGFAVSGDAEAGFKRSFQVFDHQGTAVIKIFLLPQSSEAAFDRLQHDFAAQSPSERLDIQAGGPQPPYADGTVDVAAFQQSWSELKDTHDFYPMLRRYKVSRLHALHIGGPFARQVSNGNAEKLLRDAAASAMPIMVFTGSRGNVQIHTGPVKNIVAIPGWINVMDPAFNLHLRTEPIAESWVVRKPNRECDVHSLECYDKDGGLIVQFFGKRKPGIPEDPAWTQYVNRLT